MHHQGLLNEMKVKGENEENLCIPLLIGCLGGGEAS